MHLVKGNMTGLLNNFHKNGVFIGFIFDPNNWAIIRILSGARYGAHIIMPMTGLLFEYYREIDMVRLLLCQ